MRSPQTPQPRLTDEQKALVTQFLPFVHGCVWRFVQRRRLTGASIDDLTQEAVLGAMCAAARFDASFGFHFTTYARRFVERYLDAGMLAEDTVARPRVSSIHEGSRRRLPPLRNTNTERSFDEEGSAIDPLDRPEVADATGVHPDDARPDAATLARRLKRELPRRVDARAAHIFLARTVYEGERPSQLEAGAAMGIRTKQRAKQLEERGRVAFEQWAAEIRNEVA